VVRNYITKKKRKSDKREQVRAKSGLSCRGEKKTGIYLLIAGGRPFPQEEKRNLELAIKKQNPQKGSKHMKKEITSPPSIPATERTNRRLPVALTTRVGGKEKKVGIKQKKKKKKKKKKKQKMLPPMETLQRTLQTYSPS